MAQKQMPVRRVGPLTTRAGVTFGLRGYLHAQFTEAFERYLPA